MRAVALPAPPARPPITYPAYRSFIQFMLDVAPMIVDDQALSPRHFGNQHTAAQVMVPSLDRPIKIFLKQTKVYPGRFYGLFRRDHSLWTGIDRAHSNRQQRILGGQLFTR